MQMRPPQQQQQQQPMHRQQVERMYQASVGRERLSAELMSALAYEKQQQSSMIGNPDGPVQFLRHFSGVHCVKWHRQFEPYPRSISLVECA